MKSDRDSRNEWRSIEIEPNAFENFAIVVFVEMREKKRGRSV